MKSWIKILNKNYHEILNDLNMFIRCKLLLLEGKFHLTEDEKMIKYQSEKSLSRNQHEKYSPYKWFSAWWSSKSTDHHYQTSFMILDKKIVMGISGKIIKFYSQFFRVSIQVTWGNYEKVKKNERIGNFAHEFSWSSLRFKFCFNTISYSQVNWIPKELFNFPYQSLNPKKIDWCFYYIGHRGLYRSPWWPLTWIVNN